MRRKAPCGRYLKCCAKSPSKRLFLGQKCCYWVKKVGFGAEMPFLGQKCSSGDKKVIAELIRLFLGNKAIVGAKRLLLGQKWELESVTSKNPRLERHGFKKSCALPRAD